MNTNGEKREIDLDLSQFNSFARYCFVVLKLQSGETQSLLSQEEEVDDAIAKSSGYEALATE